MQKFYKLVVVLLLVTASLQLVAEDVVTDITTPLNKRIVKTAREFKGLNYNFGGNRIANGLDCSSFVQKIYGFYGIGLPRTASEQYQYGKEVVDTGALLPGDLVFFETYRPGPSHVGIYSDKEPLFIHASSSQGITESSIFSDYFRDRYYGAKRILNYSEQAVSNNYSSSRIETSEKPVKKDIKESVETLKNRVKEVADFQAKKKFLLKQKKEMDQVSAYMKNNGIKISAICPVVFEQPVKTYVYDTTYKTANSRLTLKFGEVVYVIGGSKALNMGSDSKLVTKACVLSSDKKTIDLIDSRSLSFFPATDITDKNCLNSQPINQEVYVNSRTAQLRLYNNDYENVFGRIVPSYKLVVGTVNKGEKLKAVGVIPEGDRKGDYCILYKGNVVVAYEGDIQ